MARVKPPSRQYVQFSKRITIAVCAAWCAFRLITLVLIAFRTEAAGALTEFQRGADDVMMVAIGFYCGNSVAEKGILGYFGREKALEKDEGAGYEEEEEEEAEG